MNALVFAQKINKEGRHDASGAFVPGAIEFRKLHRTPPPVWLEDVHDRQKMLDAISAGTGLEAIVYFGHGTHNGLPSADIRSEHLPALAAAIGKASAHGCRVILYACSAGGINGFAQRLAQALNGSVQVYGHTCAGHSFTNPYVTHYPFAPDVDPWLIQPSAPLFAKWRKRIKDTSSDIWARYPFMTREAVELEAETGVRQPFPPPDAPVMPMRLPPLHDAPVPGLLLPFPTGMLARDTSRLV